MAGIDEVYPPTIIDALDLVEKSWEAASPIVIHKCWTVADCLPSNYLDAAIILAAVQQEEEEVPIADSDLIHGMVDLHFDNHDEEPALVTEAMVSEWLNDAEADFNDDDSDDDDDDGDGDGEA